MLMNVYWCTLACCCAYHAGRWAVPGNICRERNVPSKLASSVNPIGDDEERLNDPKEMNQMASSVSAVVSKDDSVQRSNLRAALQNRLVDSAVRLPSRYTIFTVQGAALNSPLDYKHMSLTGESSWPESNWNENWSWHFTCRGVNFLKESPVGYETMTRLL